MAEAGRSASDGGDQNGGVLGGSAGELGLGATAGVSDAPGGAAGDCDGVPVAVGTVESEELDEISGMVASVAQPGIFYVHNDSGDGARFFAIDEQGKTLAQLVLVGATAIDWEDIALGPGPGGDTFIYLGDIGDNDARAGNEGRDSIDVYRVAEPSLSVGQAMAQRELTEWDRLSLVYPDEAHDSEALLVDPVSSDLLLVTKETSGNASVLRASALAADGSEQTLEPLLQLSFGTAALPGSPLVTGGELSPLGDAILLRTYTSVFYWRRAPATDLAAAFGLPAQALPVPPEEHGESITFSADGLSFLTVSEGQNVAIFRADLACDADREAGQ